MGPVRLRARPHRRCRSARLHEQLSKGHGVRHPPLRGDRRAMRGRRAARQASRSRASARADVRRSGRPTGPWSRPCRATRECGRGRYGGRPRRRPLHLHLHVRYDGTAEGLHDHAPQLLRDGGQGAADRRLHGERGHDAPVPPARAQLRPSHAPAQPARRVHARLLPRPVRHRGSAPGGTTDGVPERAARLREDPHGSHGQVRRGDGRQAQAHRLGAPRGW